MGFGFGDFANFPQTILGLVWGTFGERVWGTWIEEHRVWGTFGERFGEIYTIYYAFI